MRKKVAGNAGYVSCSFAQEIAFLVLSRPTISYVGMRNPANHNQYAAKRTALIVAVHLDNAVGVHVAAT
jgi:hypothetical protein